jgi:hypothetical protein
MLDLSGLDYPERGAIIGFFRWPIVALIVTWAGSTLLHYWHRDSA